MYGITPIKQDQEHTNALADALGLLTKAFISFIVFNERCKLKKVTENTRGAYRELKALSELN